MAFDFGLGSLIGKGGTGDFFPGVNAGLYDTLAGGVDIPWANASEAWQNVKGVGTAYSNLLLERLLTPPEQTKEFAGYSTALRDTLSREAGSARSRLSDAALGGGWYDSGARIAGLGDIDRAELESWAGGIRDILLGLDARRTAEVLPFLSGASGESVNIQNANIGAALGQRGQNLGVFNNAFSSFFSGGGSSMGGAMMAA